MGRGIIDSGNMCTGKVDHMDIIAQTCPIGSGVIITKDLHGIAFTYGDLCDERHQIVGDVCRVFANPRRRMRAHRIKVPQDHSAGLGVGKAPVG